MIMCVLQCGAVCCSVLQYVAVCCSVLQSSESLDKALQSWGPNQKRTSLLSKSTIYGGAPIRRLLKIIGLLCSIQSLLQGFFTTETYNFKEPTNRSHPIADF